jgi:hypothetical protein
MLKILDDILYQIKIFLINIDSNLKRLIIFIHVLITLILYFKIKFESILKF